MSKLPVIAGVEITTDEQGRFNLNALHKASGGRDAKRPKTWLDTKQAQELLEELRQDSALGQEILNVTKGGVAPGTFAHELLAVSYAGWISPAFQLKVNQVFLDYRNGRLQPVPQFDPATALNDPATMRSLLLGYTEKVLALQDQIKEIQPKADALDLLTADHKTLTFTQAVKIISIKRDTFTNYLATKKWTYRQNGSWVAYQNRIQSGDLVYKEAKYTDENTGQVVYRPYCHITQKGLAKLAEMLAKDGLLQGGPA